MRRAIFIAAALLLGSSLFADTLRVTVWNLQSALDSPASDSSIQSMANTIQKNEPDILLLQGVRDWQTCSRLAQALKPTIYNILVCSSFRGATNTGGNRQVAILAKQKAYFSWADSWHGDVPAPGGFAFAAIQVGQQRLGFFSVLSDETSEAAAREVLQQAATVKKWDVNRVQACVIGGAISSGNGVAHDAPAIRLLQQSGWLDVWVEDPSVQSNRVLEPSEYLLAENSIFGVNAEALKESARPYPVTCELELDFAKVAGHWNARTETLLNRAAQAAARNAQRPPPDAPSAVTQSRDPDKLFRFAVPFVFGCVAGLAMIGWYLLGKKTRVRHMPALLSDSQAPKGLLPSYTVVMAPHSASGSAPVAASVEAPASSVLENIPATHTQSGAWKNRSLPSEPLPALDHELGLTAHLRKWLKEKLVRRLLSDRAALLQTQQAATLKVEAVHERLAQIESRLQLQTDSYERRIDELNCELLAAKEENRELIRARINQVKSEMEAARARLVAETNDLKAR